MQKTIENAVIVKSKTRLELLTAKFNTVQQAKFYITQNEANFNEQKAQSLPSQKKVIRQSKEKPQSQSFDDYEGEHRKQNEALEKIQKVVSRYLKTTVIERSYVPNYIFSENDLVIVVGQDGLVANTAKYVTNIPIIGINPDASRYDGILLKFTPANFEQAVLKVLTGSYSFKSVTMAEAKLNDGQRLLAFNDLFIGPSSHSSARYKITFKNYTENHSSSGIIVSTGAGSTGWLSSLFNMAGGILKAFYNTQPTVAQKRFEWDLPQLIFIVREPFLSKHSTVELAAGMIETNNELIIESLMPDSGVIFSDGIQADFLKFNSGTIATIRISPEMAKIVI
jgi:NAD kinase